MNTPKISIIMPAFNQEKYVGEAIESILNQTYNNWELIVVDDGSTDRTAEIIAGFSDHRIRSFRQPNKGVCESRNVGIREAIGEFIAFLDADDKFHPEKLEVQSEHLQKNLEVDLIFVSRIEIDQDGNPQNFYSYDGEITLSSVVLGFPFAPSDLMVRRDCIDRVGGFNITYVINEDREWYIRLLFSGCRCKHIKRFLSYRRLNNQKSFHDLPAKMNDMRNSLECAFSDPRCPQDVLALKNEAYLEINLAWSYQAAIQGEVDLANSYHIQALELDANLMNEEAIRWVEFMFHNSVRDGGDHESRLRKIIRQFVDEKAQRHQNLLDNLISRGYLLRGIREIVWGRYKNADQYCLQVSKDMVQLDVELCSIITDVLMNYEVAFGQEAADKVFTVLFEKLLQIFGGKGTRMLAGVYFINQAFGAYRNKNYQHAVKKTFKAFLRNPLYLLNRGAISMLLRSLFRGTAEWFLIR